MSIDLTPAFDNMDSSEIVKIIVNWLNTQELIDFAEDDFSVHDDYNESHGDSCEEEDEEDNDEDGEQKENKEEDITPWDKISQQEKKDYIIDYLENFPPDSLVTSFMAVLSSDDIEELAEKYFPDYFPEEDDIDDEDVEEDLLEEDDEDIVANIIANEEKILEAEEEW